MVMKPTFSFSNRNRGKLGIIVPSSNTNLEADCALLVPVGVTTHFTRVGGYDVDTIPDAGAMRTLGNADLDTQIELLMAAKVDVIGYGVMTESGV